MKLSKICQRRLHITTRETWFSSLNCSHGLGLQHTILLPTLCWKRSDFACNLYDFFTMESIVVIDRTRRSPTVSTIDHIPGSDAFDILHWLGRTQSYCCKYILLTTDLDFKIMSVLGSAQFECTVTRLYLLLLGMLNSLLDIFTVYTFPSTGFVK